FARARIGATDWNNQCELFVERAFGTSGRQASALTHYQWQKNAGRIHTGSVPPAGTAVFFRSTSKWGHVMLSIGDNKAISTGPKVYQDNHFRNRSDYLGWAYVPADW
ncbi:MAG TPA: NlpC/P60 family protein, partial [Actinokineospora sp.]|nr:NlpC/P60 family protein [Actinokineospora sp.]